MNLYVGNLNFDITEEEIKELFEQIGEVASVRLMIDRETGNSKGYGFVEMNDVEEYVIALKTLNGRELGGRNIVVNQGSADSDSGAKKRPQSNSRPPQRNNNYGQSDRGGYGNQGGYSNQGRPNNNYGSNQGNYRNQGSSDVNYNRPQRDYDNRDGNSYNRNNSEPNRDRSNYNRDNNYQSNRNNNSYNRDNSSNYRENTRPNEGGYDRPNYNNRDGGYNRPSYNNNGADRPNNFNRENSPREGESNYSRRENYAPNPSSSIDSQNKGQNDFDQNKVVPNADVKSFATDERNISVDNINIEALRNSTQEGIQPTTGSKRPRTRVAAVEKVEKNYSKENKDESPE